tara:strand:+ start:1178 stop:1525 length:348 start_codon:yes stop_codon:yes gene_type:complete
MYWFIHPALVGGKDFLGDINAALLALGVALSFSSLSDPSRNRSLAKKVFRANRIKWLTRMLLLMIILLFVMAVFLSLAENKISEISTSLFVLGIGLMANLRQLVEMNEFAKAQEG